MVDCEGKDCQYKQLQRLKKENEELKQEIINLKWQRESDYQMIEDAETLIYDNDFYKREMDKYKQALEEIREMCKRQDFNQGMRTFEILKLIDEVLR